MEINYNKPRLSFEGGLVAYIPLTKFKSLNVFVYPGMYLSHMFSIRSREWALYDFADHGVKNYDLLKRLTEEVNL